MLRAIQMCSNFVNMKFPLVLQVLKIWGESDKYNLVNGGDIDFVLDFLESENEMI